MKGRSKDARLILLKTKKLDFLLDEDLVILLAWLKQDFSFLDQKEIESKKVFVGDDGKKVIWCMLNAVYNGKTDDTMRYKLYPVKFQSVWNGYRTALDKFFSNKQDSSEYGASLLDWKQKNGIISMVRCDERTRIHLPNREEDKSKKGSFDSEKSR